MEMKSGTGSGLRPKKSLIGILVGRVVTVSLYEENSIWTVATSKYALAAKDNILDARASWMTMKKRSFWRASGPARFLARRSRSSLLAFGQFFSGQPSAAHEIAIDLLDHRFRNTQLVVLAFDWPKPRPAL